MLSTHLSWWGFCSKNVFILWVFQCIILKCRLCFTFVIFLEMLHVTVNCGDFINQFVFFHSLKRQIFWLIYLWQICTFVKHSSLYKRKKKMWISRVLSSFHSVVSDWVIWPVQMCRISPRVGGIQRSTSTKLAAKPTVVWKMPPNLHTATRNLHSYLISFLKSWLMLARISEQRPPEDVS